MCLGLEILASLTWLSCFDPLLQALDPGWEVWGAQLPVWISLHCEGLKGESREDDKSVLVHSSALPDRVSQLSIFLTLLLCMLAPSSPVWNSWGRGCGGWEVNRVTFFSLLDDFQVYFKGLLLPWYFEYQHHQAKCFLFHSCSVLFKGMVWRAMLALGAEGNHFQWLVVRIASEMLAFKLTFAIIYPGSWQLFTIYVEQ